MPGWRRLIATALMAAVTVAAAYGAGLAVGRRRVLPVFTLQQLDQAEPKLSRLLRLRMQPQVAFHALAATPCLAQFKRRHPQARSVSGAVALLVRWESGQARVADARAAAGNVDAQFASCAREAWTWTTGVFPAKVAVRPFWLSIGVELDLKARYPRLPREWERPARWQADGLEKELPPEWLAMVRSDLRVREQAKRQSRRAFLGSHVVEPLELRDLTPVFVEEIYDAVFSKEAADRFNGMDCRPSGMSTEAFTEALRLRVRISSGTAHVRASGLQESGADRAFADCLLAKIGLVDGEYDVSGDSETDMFISWPIEVPRSIPLFPEGSD